MKEGDTRVITKFYIFPRKLKGVWFWGKTTVRQRLEVIPLEFICILDWRNLEFLNRGR